MNIQLASTAHGDIMTDTELLERRKHARFKVKDGAIALIRNSSKIVGSIKDISLGGLGVKYVDLGRQLNKQQSLSVTLTLDGKKTNDIPCRLVWDTNSERQSVFFAIETRESGIEFSTALTSQFHNLDFFIAA